ncbi:kinesin light chain [Corynascus novoguineensis]|uniref:Kinesin light chain n=1 Tax=Corynascus novoguineensis TaxID=1126955 RepID=A0AAN7HFA2_9PEZI|nr:kinesin light chain [Corynascus novoguineensis]
MSPSTVTVSVQPPCKLRWLLTLLSKCRLATTPPLLFVMITFSRDPGFVNWGQILDHSDGLSRPAASPRGLGRAGKSQLAIEYAHRIRERQPDTRVFWIADAVKLSGRKQPKTNILQLVYDWLSNNQNGKWIMILDSADNRDALYGSRRGDVRNVQPFATYLPQTGKGSIIITTRNKDLAFRITERYQNLIEELDYVPLAISQTAAYIQARAPQRSPEKYQAKFSEASNAIFSTWQISFDHIQSLRPIPGWVLNPFATGKAQCEQNARARREGFSHNSNSARNSDIVDSGFEDDVAMLSDYCLIVVDETGDESEMHRLVQLSTKRWLEESEQQETFKQQCLERIAAHVHVTPSEKIVEMWARLLHSGGWYALFQGRFEIAQQTLSKERRTREAKLGIQHEATLGSISMVAVVSMDEARWKEAEELLLQVLEINKALLGAQHPHTLTDMHDLAMAYMNQGRWKEAKNTLKSMNTLARIYMEQNRWEEAEKLLVQTTEGFKAIVSKLGAEHPYTLSIMHNLAVAYMRTRAGGRSLRSCFCRWAGGEAEKLLVQALKSFRTKLGAGHPFTLTSMNNLAFSFRYQGRHTDALRLMRLCAKAR